MIEITTANDSPSERETVRRLERMLERVDTSAYHFTNRVVVEQGALPHSHPVLTLGTRSYEDDNLLLADFVHEQLHWHLVARSDAMRAAVAELRSCYHDVPVGHPDGGHDEFSTYLHLVLCPLEHLTLVHLVGESAANAVRRFWQSDHYCWIYRTVEDDWTILRELVERHGLVPEAPS